MMTMQSSSTEGISDDAPVCGNCFWRDYCLSNISFLRVDSTCVYQPSGFEPIFRVHKKVIRAQPEGFNISDLPENFFVRVNKDFDIDDTCIDKLEYAVKLLIIDALMKNNWQQKLAAYYLGISSRRMNYYVWKFKIRHHHWGKYHGRLRETSGDESKLSERD